MHLKTDSAARGPRRLGALVSGTNAGWRIPIRQFHAHKARVAWGRTIKPSACGTRYRATEITRPPDPRSGQPADATRAALQRLAVASRSYAVRPVQGRTLHATQHRPSALGARPCSAPHRRATDVTAEMRNAVPDNVPPTSPSRRPRPLSAISRPERGAENVARAEAAAEARRAKGSFARKTLASSPPTKPKVRPDA